MPKVTYLFGAGASRDCLPLVSEIPKRLTAFSNYIGQHRKATHKKFPDLPCTATNTDGEELLLQQVGI